MPRSSYYRHFNIRGLIGGDLFRDLDGRLHLGKRKINQVPQKTEAVPDHVKTILFAQGLSRAGIGQRAFCQVFFIGGASTLKRGKVQHHVQMGHEQIEYKMAFQAVIGVVLETWVRNRWKSGMNAGVAGPQQLSRADTETALPHGSWQAHRYNNRVH